MLGEEDEWGGGGEWKESFGGEEEGFSYVVEGGICLLSSTRVSITGCSAAETGVGTKNFGLALPATGLAEGTEGDWKELTVFPPPLLKVSTYLPFHHIRDK